MKKTLIYLFLALSMALFSAFAASAQNTEEGEVKYTEYIVKWYDDLDRISRAFGVPADVIARFNGIDPSKPLDRKMTLKIPVNGTYKESDLAPLPTKTEEETLDRNKDDNFEINLFHRDSRPEIWSRQSVNLAVILPFNLFSESLPDTLGRAPRKRNDYKDFYSGVLLAVRDAREKGMDVNVRTYDLSLGGTPVWKMDLRDIDAVIGPVNGDDLSKVLGKVSSRVPVVSPLDHGADSLALHYSNFISIPPDKAAADEAVLDFIASDFRSGDNVVVISEKGRQLPSRLVFKLVNAQAGYKEFSYGILDGREMEKKMSEQAFVKGVKNLVFINSEDDGFTSDAMRLLDLLARSGYDISLYAPNKVRNFAGIDDSIFHSVQLTTACPYYVEYEREDVKEFLAAYRAVCQTEPGNFAFQGYDVTAFILDVMEQYGKGWQTALEHGYTRDCLQCGVNLRRKGTATWQQFGTIMSGSGFANYSIRRLHFNKDFTVSIE